MGRKIVAPEKREDSKLTPVRLMRFERVNGQKRTIWLFECECGELCERRVDKYKEGRCKSCGEC